MYITFTCHKGFMNFLKTLNFDKHKVEKIRKFKCFLNAYNNTIVLQKKLKIKEIVL
jgi:hypothetical protein